jgi:dsDNA-binding SOS-regulon protein
MQVDDQFLNDMGLAGLQGEQRQKALEDILYNLDMRVADRISETLTEAQVTKFEELTAGEPNEEALSQWLAQNVPNYQQLIGEEAEKMRSEAQSTVDRIMGSTQNSSPAL